MSVVRSSAVMRVLACVPLESKTPHRASSQQTSHLQADRYDRSSTAAGPTTRAVSPAVAELQRSVQFGLDQGRDDRQAETVSRREVVTQAGTVVGNTDPQPLLDAVRRDREP